MMAMFRSSSSEIEHRTLQRRNQIYIEQFLCLASIITAAKDMLASWEPGTIYCMDTHEEIIYGS